MSALLRARLAQSEALVALKSNRIEELKAELAKPPATRAANQLVRLGEQVDEMRRHVERLRRVAEAGAKAGIDFRPSVLAEFCVEVLKIGGSNGP